MYCPRDISDWLANFFKITRSALKGFASAKGLLIVTSLGNFAAQLNPVKPKHNSVADSRLPIP
jgi:hypothetical protein